MKRTYLQITDQLFIELLKGFSQPPPVWVKWRIAENPLPPDARPIRATHERPGLVWLLLESESFEDVPLGEPYPVLPMPVIEQI